LIETLKDNEPLVRASAATALGSFGAQARAALPALTELQKDQATVVKLAADRAVSKISSSETRP
jgi:HEAT repeat protein